MIDIIVPTHNHLDLTKTCLDALYKNTAVPFHLIIVDDSTDGETPDYILSQHNDALFIHSDKPYRCGNQFFNVALQYTQCEYVALVMNSVMVKPRWEIVALGLMDNDPGIGIIGFKTLTMADRIESAGIELSDHWRLIDIGRGKPPEDYTCINEPYALQWAFCLLRRGAIHFLDEDLYHGFVGWDDVDNTLVIKQNGWKAVYCGFGEGYHATGATRGTDDPEKIRRNKENAVVFYKRWGLWDKYKEHNPVEALKADIAETKGQIAEWTNKN